MHSRESQFAKNLFPLFTSALEVWSSAGMSGECSEVLITRVPRLSALFTTPNPSPRSLRKTNVTQHPRIRSCRASAPSSARNTRNEPPKKSLRAMPPSQRTHTTSSAAKTPHTFAPAKPLHLVICTTSGRRGSGWKFCKRFFYGELNCGNWEILMIFFVVIMEYKFYLFN